MLEKVEYNINGCGYNSDILELCACTGAFVKSLGILGKLLQVTISPLLCIHNWLCIHYLQLCIHYLQLCIHYFITFLANVEENNSVSRALTRLSEVQEKVESLHMEQVCHIISICGYHMIVM